MEPEEIAVVLSRASELHAKLSDAIAFCVDDCPSPSSRITGLQNGDASLELRSLAAIRDSLELLEEHLESLQTLQQQQRAHRDAGLADIEESRRLFLKRLKEYRGRDLEIVQEALAFAGGNDPDKDELATQSYPATEDGEPSQSPIVSIPQGMYFSEQRQYLHEEKRSRNHVFGFGLEPQEVDGSEDDSFFEDDDRTDLDNPIRAVARSLNAMKDGMVSSRVFSFAFNAVRNGVGFLTSFLGQISGQVTGPPSKAVLIVVSTLLVLSLTDSEVRRAKSVARLSRMPAHRSHQHHIRMTGSKPSNHGRGSHSSRGRADGNKFAAGGDRRILDDEFPICVVRERVELPFFQELQTPDVLQGRG